MGVVLTWTSDGPVHLDGTQGPNNGWLVLIAAAFALAWRGPMERGSWIGVAGVFGSAVVIGWTAVENWIDSRDVGASASFGLLLVVAASVALAVAAAASGLKLASRAR